MSQTGFFDRENNFETLETLVSTDDQGLRNIWWHDPCVWVDVLGIGRRGPTVIIVVTS